LKQGAEAMEIAYKDVDTITYTWLPPILQADYPSIPLNILVVRSASIDASMYELKASIRSSVA
jgi:hypothetical protein